MDITVTPFDAGRRADRPRGARRHDRERRARHPRLSAGVSGQLPRRAHAIPGPATTRSTPSRASTASWSATSRSASRSSTTWRTPTSSSTSRPVTAAGRRPGASTAGPRRSPGPTVASGCSGWPSRRCPAGRSATTRAAGSPPRSASSRRSPRCAVASTSPRSTRPRSTGMLREGWAKAEGYSLVRWNDETPDEIVDDVAYLDGRLLEDAPMGDLELGAAEGRRRPDPARRGGPRGARPPAVQHRGQARRVRPAGRLDHARVRATVALALVPAHHDRRAAPPRPPPRRDREGREPALGRSRPSRNCASIDTWNAAVNDHMISINEAMGFRPVDGWNNYQLNL